LRIFASAIRFGRAHSSLHEECGKRLIFRRRCALDN